MIVLAFDFDGVICNSVMEIATASWNVALELRKNFDTSRASWFSPAPDDFVSFFRQARPQLEIGYQAVLIAWWFQHRAENRLLLKEIPDFDAPENEWNVFFSTIEQIIGLSAFDLSRLLGVFRDKWYLNSRETWIDSSPFYEGIQPILLNYLTNPQFACYIVTTKLSRFVEALCAANRVIIEKTHIFGLESGPKENTLKSLFFQHTPERFLFFEDRLATLERIHATPGLSRLDLCFASWGYNNQLQKERAKEATEINYLISLSDLSL
jgi:hypothetical protein